MVYLKCLFMHLHVWTIMSFNSNKMCLWSTWSLKLWWQQSPNWIHFRIKLHTRPQGCFKDLYNTDLQTNTVIQTHWNLSSIYNKVYSLILANKIDFPREYFRVLYLQNGVIEWYIEKEYLVSSEKLLATCNVRVFLWHITVPIWINDFNFKIMFHEIKTVFKSKKICKKWIFPRAST